MYIPNQFQEPRIDVLHELMRRNPLATLVTLTSDGLNANHIPLYLAADAPPFGTLRGHVARSNPICQNINAPVEVLTIFHGPNAYISPSWYATKKENSNVVPTWNYAVAHAYGTLKVIEDADWIYAQLVALTERQEAVFTEPWHVADAQPDFTEKLLSHIVGIEITITKLLGKWKISQNQPAKNQASVIANLNDHGSSELATLMQQYHSTE